MGFAKSKFMLVPGGIGTVTAMLAGRLAQGGDVPAEPEPAVTNQVDPDRQVPRAERRRAEKEARKSASRASQRQRQIMGRNRYED